MSDVPLLQPGEIQVWRVALDAPADPATLSGDELARAAAAVDPTLRRRRIRVRAVLRELLGRHTGKPPAEVPIEIADHGRPELRGGPAFNLTHSGEVMLIAIAGSGIASVGVDLDRLDRLPNWRAVAKRTFSAAEQAGLSALDPSVQAQAAVRVWVRKEAYAKARGAGFAYGFAKFSVRSDDGSGESGLVSDDVDPQAPAGWTLTDLEAPAGFAASLAYAGRGAVVRRLTWEY